MRPSSHGTQNGKFAMYKGDRNGTHGPSIATTRFCSLIQLLIRARLIGDVQRFEHLRSNLFDDFGDLFKQYMNLIATAAARWQAGTPEPSDLPLLSVGAFVLLDATCIDLV